MSLDLLRERPGVRTTTLRRLVASVAVIVAASLAAACQDARTPTAPDGAVSTSPRQTPSWQQTERGQATVELTRLVARSLDDPAVRNQLKNDMRRSPFLEHKLSVNAYLRGEGGGPLVAAMARTSDRSRSEVLDLVERLEPAVLELYLPWDEHRTSWTGGSEVIVASQFDEGQKPAAFGAGGEPYDLSVEDLEETPDRPVIALVPAETDFDDPPAPGAFENTRSRGGEAVGVYRRTSASASEELVRSTEDGGGGGGGIDWSSLPPGLYMYDNYIDDLGEGGLKGDPELEAHLTSPVEPDDENMTDRLCAGEEELGTLFFNQDDHTFDGPVRVATETLLDDFESTFGTDEGQDVSLVEDDDTTCEIKMGDDRFEEFIKATAEAVGFVEAIRRDSVSGTAIAEEGPAVVRNFVTASVNFIETADDEVGVIVQGTNQCAPDGSTREWLIQRGSEVNGCTRMRMNDE